MVAQRLGVLRWKSAWWFGTWMDYDFPWFSMKSWEFHHPNWL
jgi:hypothetical protein